LKRSQVSLIVAATLAVLGLLIYLAMPSANYRCEVCVAFEGRQACRTASAETQAMAQRTAHENACAQITSGVTGTTGCHATPALSVKWLAKR
jgi:hypothetical protein